MPECPFCRPEELAGLVDLGSNVYAFPPLNPVTEGHMLVIPARHVEHFAESSAVTGMVFGKAAQLAAGLGDANLITSRGPAATQSVRHLHVHVVPRRFGDGLALPWTEHGEQVAAGWTPPTYHGLHLFGTDTAMSVCERCSSVVADQEEHTTYHRNVAFLALVLGNALGNAQLIRLNEGTVPGEG